MWILAPEITTLPPAKIGAATTVGCVIEKSVAKQPGTNIQADPSPFFTDTVRPESVCGNVAGFVTLTSIAWSDPPGTSPVGAEPLKVAVKLTPVPAVAEPTEPVPVLVQYA